MLKRLRRKFIAIVMALVGTVLVGTLASSFYTTYSTQRMLVEGSLDRTLGRSPDDEVRRIFGEPLHMDEGRMGGLMGVLIVIEEDETLIDAGNGSTTIDNGLLTDVIAKVMVDGEASGLDKTAHIAWKSALIDDDEVRIAVVDTSSVNALLRQQAIRDVETVAVALLALLAISWWLSGWALRPVEEAWDQQRRFVADASHELKTPLAVILANTQILERDESLSEDAAHWVKSTKDEASHMKSLVNDLLQLARADETVAGGTESTMHRESIDLSDLVEASALEFEAVAFERGCLVESQISDGITMTGDRAWIERLVRILIDNACKYGERGTTVEVALASAGGHALLSVHNQGNPLDPEDLPHVFDRFYRSDKARSREKEGGFGLGLAIAKGIVDAHGGKISVASSQEDGTTFTVVL